MNIFTQIRSNGFAETKKTAFWLALFAFLLPLSAKTASLMIVFALFTHFYNSENRKPFQVILPPFLYFLVYLISAVCSETSGSLQYSLESRLPFIAFPLLFGASLLSQQQLENILKAFWLGITTALIVCTTWACLMYWKEDRSEYFFYLDLTKILDFHPTYFSWYICFGFFSGLDFLTKRWSAHTLSFKIIGGLWLFLLATFNIFLSSRIGLLAFFVLFGLWFLVEMHARKKLIIAILSIGIFCIIGYFSIFHINFLRWRLAPYIPGLIPQERVVELQHDSRKDAWAASIEVIKAKPIFGVGAGDAKAALIDVYKKHDWKEALAKNLNSHNLYLQTQVSTGIFGELSLILLIFAPLWWYKNKLSKITLFWCLLFAIYGLTESLLEVQRGTLFAAFFFSFISVLQENNES